MNAWVSDPDHFLDAMLDRQIHNVESYRFGGERVWVKKAGPRNARWRYALLGGIVGALRMRVLQPVPNLGGADAIRTEAERLRRLADAGVRVPRLLAASPRGLMLADLAGDRDEVLSLQQEMSRRGDADTCFADFVEGVDALTDVHRRGAYLSQAFARNMVRAADGRIAFIDFEDDPGRVLALAECQARDWLCYIQSTALILGPWQRLDDAIDLLARQLQPTPAFAHLVRTARRLTWLRRLPDASFIGRDGQRLRNSAQVLHGLVLRG